MFKYALALPFSLTIIMAIAPSNGWAIPMEYTLTGHVTGTITIDFSAPHGPFNAATIWDLNFNGVNYTPADPFQSQSHNDTGSRHWWDLRTGANIDNHLRVVVFDLDDSIFPNNTWRGNKFPINPQGPINLSGRWTVSPVPEPTTFLLLGSGLLGLAGYRWQQRRREGTQVA